MSNFWLRPTLTLISLAFLTLLAWAIGDAISALLWFSAGLLVYLGFHLRNLHDLATWLKQPDSSEVPHGSGMWADLFSLLYQRERSLHSSRRDLSAALERFQRAAEAMPDGIVMLDDKDRIEWCNAVAAAQLGIDLERDRGQWLSYLLRQTQFTEYLAAQNYHEPLLIKSSRTRDLTLSIQLVPFGDAQKLLLIRDITQIERVENMRRDFVANVSHELRTPLTVVGGFLETLSDAEHLDSAETRHFLQIMYGQTQRMERLVEDLLTLSKLESGNGAHHDSPVDILRLMETLYREAESLSDGHHRLTLDIQSQCGLLGNEDELRSAFGNLVSNAIRYTPDGGSITLEWKNLDDGLAFSVADTGIGIDAQHLPRLTERFYRVDRGRSRETGGTGLGLAIVKHILTRHQAKLEVESQPGKGSTFRFLFPAKRVIDPKLSNS
ncbi:MAG: phosphate regulon sensor histidine kinase PhoR [Sulfuricella sp.]|nr:phosphate regulon sensor histidine kinase PhoR [Sulfuricella sp.]